MLFITDFKDLKRENKFKNIIALTLKVMALLL